MACSKAATICPALPASASVPKIRPIFGHGDAVKRPSDLTLTFEPLTLELVRNVSRDTENLSANFDVSVTFLCRVIGKHASK